MMNDSIVRRYFKVGDVVLDSPDSVWGNKKFVIKSFHGNTYCPLVTVFPLGALDVTKCLCNFDTRVIRLVGATKRPLIKIDEKMLIRMMNRGVLEAKREFLMRINTKKL